MTGSARQALEDAEYVIGNGRYLDLIASLIAGKTVLRSSMGREVERAEKAAALAAEHRVALVSGGDPGIYGMASIVLEVIERRGLDVAVEVVPGVTAAQAAASLLGSPLSGDHVTLSLSDLLTPWAVIEKRLDLAFSMGVPVVLYNPKSRGRPEHCARALEIARSHLPPQTPVGIVQNAYRPGERVAVTTLAEIADYLEDVDMHSTLIIGGEESRIWRSGKDARGVITPRGYHRKYVY